MKRLHSYLTYPFVLSWLIMDIAITYGLLYNYDVSARLVVLLLVINAIFITCFILFILDLKRVYIDGSTIYIYDLYSRVPYAFDLKDVTDFQRDNSRASLLWGIYKLTIAVDDGQCYYSFMKNKLIFNVGKYFDGSI
jgi:hypothetical protein